ncbi:MAG: hypothetical protein ACTHQ3_15875 [Motilibacteraceae bacterium]
MTTPDFPSRGNWTCPSCGKFTFEVIHSCPVVVVDAEKLTPQAVLVPCTSSAVAVLGVPGPTRVPCGLLDGHDGLHEFCMMWRDEEEAR